MLKKESKPNSEKDDTDQSEAVLVRNDLADRPIQWLPVAREPKPKPEGTAVPVRVAVGEFMVLAESNFDEATFIRVCKSLKTLC
jgi:hypothetical protein